MARIAGNINDGAMSFLQAEYSILFVFVLAVAALPSATSEARRIKKWCEVAFDFLKIKLRLSIELHVKLRVQKLLVKLLVKLPVRLP